MKINTLSSKLSFALFSVFVFRSFDNDENWNNSGLSDININSFGINSNDEIIVGNDGMFLSNDKGDSRSN